MQLEWYNAHAEEMQKLFIIISNTYNEQATLINATLHSDNTIAIYIALLVIVGVGLLSWLISVLTFGAITKSIIIGNEPEDVVWLLNHQKITLNKKTCENSIKKD